MGPVRLKNEKGVWRSPIKAKKQRVTVRYLIKEIAGSVRRTSLWDEASEGHAIQNLGQEIILNEASLAQEGSLDNVRIRAVTIPHCLEQCNLVHMDAL